MSVVSVGSVGQSSVQQKDTPHLGGGIGKRHRSVWALIAAVIVAASATACCRGSSSSTGSGSSGIGSPTAFNVGDSVDVEWNGGWWQARILSVKGSTYRIHYVGWGNNWDESVPARRVRVSTGTAKRGSGPN